jgi:molecular chaperone DnaK
MQIVSKAVGIDLGTTNSAVAVMNPSDTDIIIHRDPVANRETTPSCVWKDPRTGEVVVGHKAFRRVGGTPSPIRSVKRLMGRQEKLRLTDEDVSPEEVSAAILREMRSQIEQDLTALNNAEMTWRVDRAIITVPAYFDQPQIAATNEAGVRAGLEVLDLLHEPTAAACYHCWRTNTQNGTFLVYDLGGGTFDVTILRCSEGVFQVLGVSGNNMLGGDDMDTLIAEYLLEMLVRDGYALDLDRRNNAEHRLLFDSLKLIAEGAKKGLSNAGEFMLRDTSLTDNDGTKITIEMLLERPKLESLIKGLVDSTIPYCFEALDKASKGTTGVSLADIDEIVLTGGSTHIPLVRETVRRTFCADPDADEPRARCVEPVYEKVDTVVALGAAIRASAIGGLAVSNEAETVRVSFRGTAATEGQTTHVGGQARALQPEVNLDGGSVRLLVADTDYQDEQDLGEEGAFGFRGVPLQPGAENVLTFQLYDQAGAMVATVGRAVTQSRTAVAPTGGGGSTAVLSKPILMGVMRGGEETRKTLFSEMASLPDGKDFSFGHPGDTELVRMPLYQSTRHIDDVLVSVSSSLPRGTPITLNVYIDAHYLITVKGKIGEHEFDAALEMPKDRELPTDEEEESLRKQFAEAVTYLPPGKRNVEQVRFRQAEERFAAAKEGGDTAKAVHDFEEMEEQVYRLTDAQGPLEPPKEAFDQLVQECYEINRYVAQEAATQGQPHDEIETQKNIDAQRQQGESAFAAGDQKAYGDVITALERIREYLVQVVQKVSPSPPSDPVDGAIKHCQSLQHRGEQLAKVAQAADRPDLAAEINQIGRELEGLQQEAARDPRAAQTKASQYGARLEQIKNLLYGRAEKRPPGDLVEDIDTSGRP